MENNCCIPPNVLPWRNCGSSAFFKVSSGGGDGQQQSLYHALSPGYAASNRRSPADLSIATAFQMSPTDIEPFFTLTPGSNYSDLNIHKEDRGYSDRPITASTLLALKYAATHDPDDQQGSYQWNPNCIPSLSPLSPHQHLSHQARSPDPIAYNPTRKEQQTNICAAGSGFSSRDPTYDHSFPSSMASAAATAAHISSRYQRTSHSPPDSYGPPFHHPPPPPHHHHHPPSHQQQLQQQQMNPIFPATAMSVNVSMSMNVSPISHLHYPANPLNKYSSNPFRNQRSDQWNLYLNDASPPPPPHAYSHHLTPDCTPGHHVFNPHPPPFTSPYYATSPHPNPFAPTPIPDHSNSDFHHRYHHHHHHHQPPSHDSSPDFKDFPKFPHLASFKSLPVKRSKSSAVIGLDGSIAEKLNLCRICGKTYARPSTLKTHLRTHSGDKPYVCSTCNKSFSQAANLTAHVRTHSGEKPFRCTVCDRRFSQSSSVTTHMRTHSGERPYRCRNCKKTFSDSSTLTKHLRIHSGEKPYQCKVCLLRFSQSGNLNRHMRVHCCA